MYLLTSAFLTIYWIILEGIIFIDCLKIDIIHFVNCTLFIAEYFHTYMRMLTKNVKFHACAFLLYYLCSGKLPIYLLVVKSNSKLFNTLNLFKSLTFVHIFCLSYDTVIRSFHVHVLCFDELAFIYGSYGLWQLSNNFLIVQILSSR